MDEVGELGRDEQSMLLRAIEEKRFLPVGADHETGSDFQLICGTNLDLQARVGQGRFREDLLARINLWTFELPGLAWRPEDIEPNLAYELDRYAERHNSHVTFNKEARERFLSFAVSPQALWTANFRDLNGTVTRMATLSRGGRITKANVEEEIARLQAIWRGPLDNGKDEIVNEILGPEAAGQLDLFDYAQLAQVLKICRTCKSISEAGRRLFAVSRNRRSKPNDADRLRKYLARFGIQWLDIH